MSMEIEAKVITNAKKDNIQMENGKLKIRIGEQPLKGKANKAIEKLIKQEIGFTVQIISGTKDRNKVLQIDCSEQELVNKIGDINGKNIH
jgi:uncharacterized protein (TIGR00251 family)